MIQSGDWDKVRKLLNSKMGKEVTYLRDSTNLNILGIALGSRAPLDVAALILNLNPNLVLERDMYGAVPLHIGCLNGISVDVVKLILELDGGQSSHIPDNDNRTALHHAVEFSCKTVSTFDDSSSMSIMYEESVEVIEHLLSIAPETVHFVTSRGDCPLDIPHEFRVKLNLTDDARLDEIYYLMKETSIELYRGLKKEWELFGYNTALGISKVDDEQVEVNTPFLMSSQECSSKTSLIKSELFREIDKMSICDGSES